jgi:hypothetical protein
VRREAANVLPIIVGIRDSTVQLVSTLGVYGVGCNPKQSKAIQRC